MGCVNNLYMVTMGLQTFLNHSCGWSVIIDKTLPGCNGMHIALFPLQATSMHTLMSNCQYNYACCLVYKRRRDGSDLTSKASYNLLNGDTYR